MIFIFLCLILFLTEAQEEKQLLIEGSLLNYTINYEFKGRQIDIQVSPSYEKEYMLKGLPSYIEIREYLPEGLKLIKAYPNYTKKKQNCYIWEISNFGEYAKGQIKLTVKPKEKNKWYKTTTKLFTKFGDGKILLDVYHCSYYFKDAK